MEELMVDDPAAKAQLTLIATAYALLLYGAALVLIAGLALKARRLLRDRTATRPTSPGGGPAVRAFRFVTDDLLLRDLFFADRWAWIFGICLRLGVIVIALRHLRYAVDSAWMGPLWRIEVLVQPLGLYGSGLFLLGILGFWARRILVPALRARTGLGDHLMLALMTVIPLTGYVVTLLPTDIASLKAFVVGLVTFHWRPLPTEPALLLHLWLGAALMAVLPFSRILAPDDRAGTEVRGVARLFVQRRPRRVVAAVLGLLLAITAASSVVSATIMARAVAPTDLVQLVKSHKYHDAQTMTRYHGQLLLTYRDAVFHKGLRAPEANIERCVTCHVTDPGGQAVGYDDTRHFCRQCHEQVAVAVDCFECHDAKPTPDPRAALDPLIRQADAVSLRRPSQER